MRRALIVLALVLWGATASAQSVVNPTIVQFVPSADEALVANYQLWIYAATDLRTPVRIVDLGKPTVGADGTMTVVFSTLTTALPDGAYRAKVAALSSVGQGVSDWSNDFSYATGTGSPPPMKPTGITARLVGG